MSITVIFGDPGVGKTALAVHKAEEKYKTQGHAVYRKCCKKIDEANAERKKKLTKPDRVPIYSDYPIRFKIGYEKFYETYMMNGFYLGLADEEKDKEPDARHPIYYVPPCSTVILSEVQRYYDSRKSSTTPSRVSRFYEMHRHYELDLILDLQRPGLLDLNIKENANRFINPICLEHKKTAYGVIESSRWNCREFDSWSAVERFLNAGEKTYTETTYEHRGNIFNLYDSYFYFEKFIPDEGKDFQYLPQTAENDGFREFYSPAEPKTYRSAKK